ncbi:hypothetical protein [Tatumella ptyseos]|uniref:Uncharacterized protein n=1 Tax=Tatumella ptyseos TaxID=82987 RepID=A0A2X5PM05_9GAMM|nr:hypothetical protein [Tatumella ptyseos]SQK74450.1 Uncharacterised protein [Tatumella ptyseos]
MGVQSKSHLFGCSSVHRVRSKTARTDLTPDQFLALKETQDYLKEHPEAVSVDGDDIFASEALCRRYIHLLGNKKLKKAFRKAMANK